jgi:hypothetical protein
MATTTACLMEAIAPAYDLTGILSVSGPDGGADSAAKTEEDAGANVKPRHAHKPNS